MPLASATKAGSDGPDLETLGLEPRVQQGPLTIHEVPPEYPLAKAGIEKGDLLLAIDGITLHSTASVMAYLQQNGDKAVALTIGRAGRTLRFSLTPMLGDDGTGREVARQVIEFTDFPLDEIKLYLDQGTLILPGEY